MMRQGKGGSSPDAQKAAERGRRQSARRSGSIAEPGSKPDGLAFRPAAAFTRLSGPFEARRVGNKGLEYDMQSPGDLELTRRGLLIAGAASAVVTAIHDDQSTAASLWHRSAGHVESVIHHKWQAK